MTDKRVHKPGSDLCREPKIGLFAVLSLVLHLGAAVLFSGVLISSPVREHRPVYFVDLSQLPVANPRAGRPDGARQPSNKPPAPKPAAPQAVQAPAPKPKPEKPAEPAKPKTERPKKTVAKTKPKTEKAKPPVENSGPNKTTRQPKPDQPVRGDTEKDYEKTLDAIKAMQAKAEREALKKKLAALAAMDTRSGPGDSAGDTPLGMPGGTGDEIGVSQELWLQTWLKKNWSYSKYQATRLDLEAEARIIYDAQGNLVKYEFLKKSGDSFFDDSVTKAILKEKKLPFSPKNRIDVVVIFNLKDLMD